MTSASGPTRYDKTLSINWPTGENVRAAHSRPSTIAHRRGAAPKVQ
jgi:hypothetical protein